MRDRISESETLALKNYTLNLSDHDTEAIARKAGSYNMTVPRLLEHFIVDLIDGTYTNGSDERMYANQWFERCWFARESNRNLITFICDHNYDFDDIQKISQYIEDTKKNIRETQDKIESTDDSWKGITQMSYDDSGKPTGYIRSYETHEDFIADCREAIESYEEDIKDYTSQLNDIKTEFASYMGTRPYDWDKELQSYLQWYNTSVPDIIE
jgi:archaellum component FlaC